MPRGAPLLLLLDAIVVLSMLSMPVSSMLSSVRRPLRLSGRRLTSSLAAEPSRNIAVVGGGLAGLSTTFHLLEKNSNADAPLHVTVIDKAPVGTAGASCVAGGLVHPLSPRGKLVHWGLEGLKSTNRLVDVASRYSPQVIMRNELYRAAQTNQNVQQLTLTADQHPDFCEWLEAADMNRLCGIQSSLGGVRLTGACRVIHVPSYLRGLRKACVDMANNNADSCSTTKWIVETNAEQSEFDWKHRLEAYDAVVFAAGSALWQNNILKGSTLSSPVDLIRGQSIEMSMPPSASERQQQAVLCGKYVSPLLDESKVLIGATHEYQPEPLSQDQVAAELKKRSYEVAPYVWDHGEIDKVTCGYRVQSRRGALGRLPIVGRLAVPDIHSNAWILTGLSSRGLLYHGIYGDVLTDMILEQDDRDILIKYPHLNWWRETSKVQK